MFGTFTVIKIVASIATMNFLCYFPQEQIQGDVVDNATMKTFISNDD
jgi:hypothetical protein